jgi:isopenicillin N synthase-like dioxygenase
MPCTAVRTPKNQANGFKMRNLEPYARDLVHFSDSRHNVIAELLRSLAEEVGLAPQTPFPFIEEKNYSIACLFYPATAAESSKNRGRAPVHTDYECLILLFNDLGEGL